MKKKKVILLLSTLILSTSLVGCGAASGSLSASDTPATEVSIDGKNNDDLTGYTYLYDYGDGFRLYADNYTHIVYVLYYGSGGTGAKATNSMGLSPWLSENGKYCYIDTETKTIKELDSENKSSDTDDENNEENTDDSTPKNATSETGESSSIDDSITDKVNQNAN